MTDKKKPQTKFVTVPVEFIRLAVVMRQRQRKFFASRHPADLPPAKKSEVDFDAVLSVLCKELESLNIETDNPTQGGLL